MISTCVTLVQIKQQLCSDFEIYVMDHHITWYGSLACQRKRPDVGILHEIWQINVSRPLPATGILVPKQFILTLFIICLVSYRHSLKIKEWMNGLPHKVLFFLCIDSGGVFALTRLRSVWKIRKWLSIMKSIWFKNGICQTPLQWVVLNDSGESGRINYWQEDGVTKTLNHTWGTSTRCMYTQYPIFCVHPCFTPHRSGQLPVEGRLVLWGLVIALRKKFSLQFSLLRSYK